MICDTYGGLPQCINSSDFPIIGLLASSLGVVSQGGGQKLI
ncbi:MAG: hypothetical protein V7K48_04880 [Nostoc sp.]